MKTKVPWRPKGWTLRQDLEGVFLFDKYKYHISHRHVFFWVQDNNVFFDIYSWTCTNHTTNVFDCPLQYNLRRAAKARIERMVKDHKTRTDLNAASHIADEWKSGDRNALADLLQRVNWDKDCSFIFSEYILICLWAYVTWFQHESTNYTCIYISYISKPIYTI